MPSDDHTAGVSQNEKLREVLESGGHVILSDSGTVHVRLECRHVDRMLVGGPNSEASQRNVRGKNLTGLLESHKTDLSLCRDCARWWDHAE